MRRSNAKVITTAAHYDPQKVGDVWRVAYAERELEAEAWADRCELRPVVEDRFQVALLAVDVQNTFCIPGFELFVGRRSGQGAVEDNRRLCEFIYHNLDMITRVFPTLDTHQAAQIFHPVFFVNDAGEHPAPHTQITVEEIERGVWRFNTTLATTLSLNPVYVQEHLLHYTRALGRSDRALCVEDLAVSCHVGQHRPRADARI
jgi:hypothetical protein